MRLRFTFPVSYVSVEVPTFTTILCASFIPFIADCLS